MSARNYCLSGLLLFGVAFVGCGGGATDHLFENASGPLGDESGSSSSQRQYFTDQPAALESPSGYEDHAMFETEESYGGEPLNRGMGGGGEYGGALSNESLAQTSESHPISEHNIQPGKAIRSLLEEEKQFEYRQQQDVTPTRPRANTSNEKYDRVIESGFKTVSQAPLSTFGIDVDTASYANVRRFLESGQVPPADAIRVEELINYFTYNDVPPQDGRPFAVHSEVADSPWHRQRKLVRIGLKGQEVERAERQPASLVFLIDISGSMRTENKLPLVKRSLHRLLEELGERDRVAIVTYASGVQTPLPSTPANQQHRISQAVDSLVAGGSTNGSAGLHTAYQVARQQFREFGTNRVILCSDGDFNVGITDEQQLVQLITNEARSGVFLSVLGFGVGNYKDSIAEILADHGNGNYAYIDSYSEARKVLVDQMNSTLETIAKDVKIQVEFNPQHVAAYRLIGYENRTMAAQDFRNDRKDAGDIGAGHSVTALYEVIPAGGELPQAEIPELRYQKPALDPKREHTDELLTVRLRYKLPNHDTGTEFTHVVENDTRPFAKTSENFRFAAAVATFGMILRNSQFAENLSWQDVRHWAKTSIGSDEKGYRTEFLNLVARAEQLIHRPYAAEDLSWTPRIPEDEFRYSGNRLPAGNSWRHYLDLGVENVVAILVVVGASYGIATVLN